MNTILWLAGCIVYVGGISFFFWRVRASIQSKGITPYCDDFDYVLDGLTLICLPLLWPIALFIFLFFAGLGFLGKWASRS